MGAAAVPIIAAVAAAGVSSYSASQAAKKRDKATAAGILKQGRTQREANAKISENLAELEQSRPDDERATRSSQIRDQLRREQSIALAGIQNTGGGDAVTERAGQARDTAVGFGDFIGDNLAGVDAAGLQRQGEGFAQQDVSSALASLGRDSAQQDYLTRLRVAGIRPSPLLGLVSAGLSGYAGSGGGFGGGKSIAGSGGAPSGLGSFGNTSPQDFFSNASAANQPFNIFDLPPRRASGIGINLGG